MFGFAQASHIWSSLMKDWKKYDDPSLTGHHGMVWFRKSFDLTQDQAAQDAVLSLGAIDLNNMLTKSSIRKNLAFKL